MKKIVALCLLISMFACFLPMNVAADVDGGSCAKTFLDTSMLVNQADKNGNTVISGWDLNTAGGTIHPRAFLQMVDTSTEFPVEAVRAIDDIECGEVTFEFYVYLDKIQCAPGISECQTHAGRLRADDPAVRKEYACIRAGAAAGLSRFHHYRDGHHRDPGGVVQLLPAGVHYL